MVAFAPTRKFINFDLRGPDLLHIVCSLQADVLCKPQIEVTP
jgi:hypothetical protein